MAITDGDVARPLGSHTQQNEYVIEDGRRRAGSARSAHRFEFQVWSRNYVVRLALFDVVVGALAVIAAIAVPLTHIADRPVWPMAVAGAFIWPLSVLAARGYERSTVGVGGDELRAVFRAGIIVVVVCAFLSVIWDIHGMLTAVVVAVPIANVLSIGVRYVARKRLHHRQARGVSVRRVAVVGSLYAALELCQMLAREPQCGMQVVGVCVAEADIQKAGELGLRVIGDLDHVRSTIREFDCDAIAVTSGDSTRQNYLRELAWSLEDANVELLVHPGLVEVAGPRMHIRPHAGLPLLHIDQPHFTGWRRFVKRFADLAMTGIGLLVSSPVMLAIALAIKITDRGPVFFKQTRVGVDGHTFTMWKFRSMAVDAEARLAELRAQNEGSGLLFKLKDDPRITRVGKFLRRYSLDELPQLFNIMSGEMSLVGPRPPLQSEVAKYGDHVRRRLLVKPGLTGLWQVSGRSLLSWEESVRLDLRYVENWTLTFDLLIMWKTAFAVLAKRGAF